MVGTSVQLSLNSGFSTTTLNSDGSYSFPKTLSPDTIYSVVVSANPTGPTQTCTVSNPNGTVSGTVNNINVSCVTNTYTISGSVVGLDTAAMNNPDPADSVPIMFNGSTAVIVNGDSLTYVSTPFNDGSNVPVQIVGGPSDKDCNFDSSSTKTTTVNIAGSNISGINITCAALTAGVQANVTGLDINGLSGLNIVNYISGNGSSTSQISNINSDGTYAFDFQAGLTNYDVLVTQQPVDGICNVSSGSGVMPSPASTQTVNISCTSTAGSPTVLNLSVPLEGETVGATTSQKYQITVPSSVTTYTFSITNLDNNLSLYVYSNSSFTNLVCSSANAGLTNETCSTSGYLTYYITVLNVNPASASFTVKVNPPPVNQGSAGSPVALILESAHAGEVAASGSSYFSVPVTASYAYYEVTIKSMSNNVNLYVYTDSGYSALAGSSLREGTLNEQYNIAAAGGQSTLYIKVADSSGVGATFDLRIAQKSPVALTAGVQYNGLIPPTNVSTLGNSMYYSVPVLGSTAYTISVSNLQYDFDLFVYTDTTFSSLAGSSVNTGVTNEVLNYTTGAGQTALFIRVLDHDGLGSEVLNLLTLDVIQGGYVNEGTTASPIPLTVGERHYGTIDTGGNESCSPVNGTGNSYYSYPVSNGVNYTFSLTSTTGDFDLCVYSASGFSTLVASSLNVGAYVNELTTWTTTVTTVYVRVLSYNSPAGSFVLTVLPTASIVNQGTSGSPVGIVAGTQYDGTVGLGGDSFYSVPVNPNTTYIISMTDIQEDYDLYVYNNSGYAGYDSKTGWVIRPFIGGVVNEIGSYTTGSTETMLYIVIYDYNGSGGIFSLKVQ
jgi:hypothetical protein